MLQLILPCAVYLRLKTREMQDSTAKMDVNDTSSE